MSDQRPPRRRRIAGESRPGAEPAAPSARKVVRRPVARPGAPRPEEPAEVEQPEVEAVVDAPADPDTDTTDPTVDPGPTTDPEPIVDAPPARPAPPRVGRARSRTSDDTTTDATADTTTEALPDAAPDAPARPRDRRHLLVVALTVLAVALGAVGAAYGFTQWRASQGVASAHEQAADAAASAAETILSYRFDQLEQYQEGLGDVLTPSYADEFADINPALEELAPQRRIQVEATTRNAAALPCGDDCERDRARVLVFVDQARIADGTTVPTVFGNRVELTMVETDGRWLVDGIDVL